MGAKALATHGTIKFHLNLFILIQLRINRCWVIKLLSMKNDEPFHSCINASLCPSVFPNLRSIPTIIDRGKEYVKTPDQSDLHPPVKIDCHQTWRTFVSLVLWQACQKKTVSDVHCSTFSSWQYHGCWCPGSLCRHGIRTHDSDYAKYVSSWLTRMYLHALY